MRFRSRSRPSAAIAVAVVALSVALVGTAVAGTEQLTKVTTAKVRKIAKKQANKAINKQAPGLAVGSASTASNAGEAAHSATAGVFAHINSDGSVDASRSLGFEGVRVSHPDDGVYCFSGFGFTPRSIDGTVDSADGPGVVEASVIPDGFVSCPQTAQAELVTFTPDTVTFQDYDGGFYVHLY